MRKFKAVKEKYLLLNVRENNIDFAIDAIKYGTARELILVDLMASHRAMNMTQATNMLNDLYAAYGGEHKKENTRGYIYSAMFFGVALCIGMAWLNDHDMISGKLCIIGIACGILGVFSFLLALFGKFREEKVNRFAGNKE